MIIASTGRNVVVMISTGKPQPTTHDTSDLVGMLLAPTVGTAVDRAVARLIPAIFWGLGLAGAVAGLLVGVAILMGG